MTETNSITPEEVSELISSLLKKEGTWVDWGRSCQKLQKAGYPAQQIFEETGFQSSQQNLIIVASQVYDSLVKSQATEEILTYYRGPKSDILYELRILNHEQRLAAAEVAKAKLLEIEGAHELAKDFQEFCRLSQVPSGFTRSPGDAVAYQCWKRAKQKKDLQERLRLIAKGLKFAHSPTAREALERLLTDSTVTGPIKSAPLLPVYRLEEEEQMANIVPVVGSLPLTKEKLESVPSLTTTEPFKIVQNTIVGQVVPLPGWPVVLKAGDPVAFLAQSEQLPRSISSKSETVLVVVDRSVREWEENSYFLAEKDELLELLWFPERPDLLLLGKLLIILRPKNILDEENITQPWQMDD